MVTGGVHCLNSAGSYLAADKETKEEWVTRII